MTLESITERSQSTLKCMREQFWYVLLCCKWLDPTIKINADVQQVRIPEECVDRDHSLWSLDESCLTYLIVMPRMWYEGFNSLMSHMGAMGWLLYSAKETYNCKEPTNRSHPIPPYDAFTHGTLIHDSFICRHHQGQTSRVVRILQKNLVVFHRATGWCRES